MKMVKSERKKKSADISILPSGIRNVSSFIVFKWWNYIVIVFHFIKSKWKAFIQGTFGKHILWLQHRGTPVKCYFNLNNNNNKHNMLELHFIRYTLFCAFFGWENKEIIKKIKKSNFSLLSLSTALLPFMQVFFF